MARATRERLVHIYCMRFNPEGCLVFSLLIQVSFVLKRTFRLSVVWATILASTSFVMWLMDVKWQETGLTLLPCLMSVRWPRKCTWKVLPDCPTYCRPHFLQLMMYITCFVLQLKRPFMSIFSLVFHEMIWSVFYIYGQAAQNFPHGELPFSINWGFKSVRINNCLRFVAFLCTTRVLLSSIGLSSLDISSICQYLDKILAIGGLKGWWVMMKGMICFFALAKFYSFSRSSWFIVLAFATKLLMI